jgi:pantetheine-phosphate adenylyltransferase
MQKKIAIFPGSFDPITIGHVDVVNRALPLFDEIIIAIGSNSQKNALYTLEQRTKWIEQVFAHEPKVKVDHYDGLTINYCVAKKAQFIVRGIRSAADFEYEKTIAHLNQEMVPNIETILILTSPRLSMISSTIVREIIKGKGDVSKFVPERIIAEL